MVAISTIGASLLFSELIDSCFFLFQVCVNGFLSVFTQLRFTLKSLLEKTEVINCGEMIVGKLCSYSSKSQEPFKDNPSSFFSFWTFITFPSSNQREQDETE